MLIFITSILHSIFDALVAIFDVLTRRRRRRYASSIFIKAPREHVWSFISASDVHFVEPDLRIKAEPIPGCDETYRAHVTLKGKALPSVAYRVIERREGHALTSVHLPEFSEASDHYGDNDVSSLILADAGGGTLYTMTREVTHQAARTRISAPLALRAYTYMIKRELERQAGTLPASSNRWLTQIILVALSIASFVWLAGWTDALILVAMVLLHEFGHVLAMWCVGLSVGFVGLVPFIGGVAAPKTPYTSDWQLGFVALMGPGFSVVPTFALYWLGEMQSDHLLAHAAALFAFINAVNLAPIPPLDGGLVLRALLSGLSVRLAHVIAWMGLAVGFAIAAYVQLYLLAVVLAFSALQLVNQASLRLDSARRRLSWGEGILLLALTGLVLAAYAWITPRALALEDLI